MHASAPLGGPCGRTGRASPTAIAGLLLVVAGRVLGGGHADAARPDGELEIAVVEAGSGKPLAARVRLRNARQRPVVRGLGVAGHGDHFYVDGAATLGLRRGQYTFDLDAGWGRRTRAGHFEIQRRAQDSKQIEVRTFADLAEEGWHAADLDCDRPLLHLGVVLQAEQVDYTPLVAWRSEAGGGWRRVSRVAPRGATIPGGVAEHAARVAHAGGDLLLVSPSGPMDAAALPPHDRLSVADLREARERGLRIVACDPAAWRLPVWLAADVLDAVMVLGRDQRRAADHTSPGRPPDARLFPGRRGKGRWREAVYFHTLNAGLRLPAVAGSGSGDTPSPLGANRVYAACPDGFSIDDWWAAVDAGQTVVTNGPLLRPRVHGRPPGHVFRLDGQGAFAAPIALNLSTRETIEYLDLIQDGRVVASVGLRDWASAGGRLPELQFNRSGWFSVRAATTASDRYQLALSGPFYVEGPGGPQISRASCRFFLDWLAELPEPLAAASPEAEADVAAAIAFWEERLSRATAD
ncbi:MAG: hypothetical protein AAF790_08380 [Planctomycetota bacterium]